MKEDFLKKFKNYNKELEKILEKKKFSEEVKNLLLSMMYKIEISYNDYIVVKKLYKKKQKYLDNILENICNCNEIILIKPNDENFEAWQEKKFEIDLIKRKIIVLANELDLLSAILEFNNFLIKLDESYNLIRNSMPFLLNMGNDIERVEVLRDFNAWSWNISTIDIKNVAINLVFQIIKIAININVLDDFENKTGYCDIVNKIEKILEEKYGSEIKNEIIYLIFKISIIIYIKYSESERIRLKEEKNKIKIELNEINNKKQYIEKNIKQKRILFDEIKNIDVILNNREMLLKEFEERNKKLNKYNRFFSISDLVERIQREKKKKIDKIELCNKNIQPLVYIENKEKIKKEYKLLEDIEFNGNDDFEQYLLELQKVFIKKILESKIEKSFDRTQIIKCIYELRYYCLLPYNEQLNINSVSELNECLSVIKEKLIKKLIINKLINTFSTNEKNDILIIKKIFELRIINIEDIFVEIRKKQNSFIISFFDEKDTLESKFEMNLKFDKKDRIKFNRKIKLIL